jgi:hypothetical protein
MHAAAWGRLTQNSGAANRQRFFFVFSPTSFTLLAQRTFRVDCHQPIGSGHNLHIDPHIYQQCGKLSE